MELPASTVSMTTSPFSIVRDLDPAELERPAPPRELTAPEVADRIVHGIAAERGDLLQEDSARRAAGPFSEMKDDLPWQD